MHKDAQYQTKPPTTDGFGDWKPPANFQISQKMAMDTEELARRSAILRIISGLYGRFSHIWVVSERREDQVAQREFGSNPGSTSSSHVFRVCGAVQPTVAAEGCFTAELRLLATSSQYCAIRTACLKDYMSWVHSQRYCSSMYVASDRQTEWHGRLSRSRNRWRSNLIPGH